MALSCLALSISVRLQGVPASRRLGFKIASELRLFRGQASHFVPFCPIHFYLCRACGTSLESRSEACESGGLARGETGLMTGGCRESVSDEARSRGATATKPRLEIAGAVHYVSRLFVRAILRRDSCQHDGSGRGSGETLALVIATGRSRLGGKGDDGGWNGRVPSRGAGRQRGGFGGCWLDGSARFVGTRRLQRTRPGLRSPGCEPPRTACGGSSPTLWEGIVGVPLILMGKGRASNIQNEMRFGSKEARAY